MNPVISDSARKPEHQYTKVLMFEGDGDWEQKDGAWRKRAVPVYRIPLGGWKKTENNTKHWIYWIPKANSKSDTAAPNDQALPAWLRCYWDGQAGRWVVAASVGSAGSTIVFRFVTTDYGYGEESEDCGERDEPDELYGEVVRVSCGASRPVFDEDESGVIPLVDELGLVAGRDYRAIEGRLGFATLMREGDENGYETCYWSIVNVNLKRWRQVVSDEIWQADRIKIERELHLVDDHCKLPDEYVQGIVCEDEYPTDAYIYGQ